MHRSLQKAILRSNKVIKGCLLYTSLGDRVVLFTPHPGRFCEEYFVDLPHPRDINSRDLAQLSSRITRDWKGAMA